MASLQGIINPSQGTAESQIEQRSILGQDVPSPTLGGFVGIQTQNALEQGHTYNLLGVGYSAGDNRYSQQQLEVMHPDTPKDFWKGGATAFQAEMIIDKRTKQRQNEEIKQFLLGANPNWAQESGMWTLGMAVDLGAGLTDPITLAAFGAAGKVASVASESIALSPSARVMSRIMQEPLAKVSNTFMGKVATSRIGSLFGHELAVNMIGETAVMYPLKKAVLDEWTKGEETTLVGTLESAFGSALAFSALKYVGGGLWNKAKGAGAEFTERTREYFAKGKDKANAHINSEATNEAAALTAAADALVSAHGTPAESISEKLSNKAFMGTRNVVFRTTKAFTGLFEKTSGKSDYLGERFGNTHVFSSDSNATQGMFDIVAKNGNTFEIYGHDGNINTIDLEVEKLVNFQEVIDVLDNPLNINPEFLDIINEGMTLAEVFRKINDYSKETGMSGKDIVDMFDKINDVFAANGYEGTIHTEAVGKTRHSVLSVFEKTLKSEHLEKVHEGQTDSPIDPTPEPSVNEWTTKEVELGNGEKAPVVDVIAEDDYYSNDQEALDLIKSWLDPEFENTLSKTNEIPEVVKEINEKMVEVSDDIEQSINIGNLLQEETLKIEGNYKKSLAEFEKIQKDFKKLQEYAKNNSPEEERTVAKTMANCIRMH